MRIRRAERQSAMSSLEDVIAFPVIFGSFVQFGGLAFVGLLSSVSKSVMTSMMEPCDIPQILKQNCLELPELSIIISWSVTWTVERRSKLSIALEMLVRTGAAGWGHIIDLSVAYGNGDVAALSELLGHR